MNQPNRSSGVEKEAKRVTNYTSEALSLTRDAEVKLRSREKIATWEDRAIFAGNLGAMVEKVQREASRDGRKITLSRLFQEAYGEQGGQSLFKKRERLVTFSYDKNPSEDFYVYGHHYLGLLKALLPYLDFPEDWSEPHKYDVAVHQLIAGTSYDSPDGYADRARTEYRREIEKFLSKLVDKVLEDRDVNLDWMRQWVEDHGIGVLGTTGVMEEVIPSYEHNPHINQWSYSTGDVVESRLMPCVRIATVTIDHPVEKYLHLEIPKYKGQVNGGMIQDAACQLIGEENFADEYEEDSFPEKLNSLFQIDDWQRPPGRHHFYGPKIVFCIDLEIRYDKDFAKWRPVILLRHPQLNNQNVTTDFMVSADGARVEEIFWELDSETATYAAEDTETRDSVSFNLFETELHVRYGLEYNILGQSEEGGFYPPQPKFYKFLLQEIPDSWGEPEFELNTIRYEPPDDEPSYEGGFVKAPTNTLAYWILKNLAYAPEEERLDQLLLKDARHKYRKVKELADRCEKEYQEAISRL